MNKKEFIWLTDSQTSIFFKKRLRRILKKYADLGPILLHRKFKIQIILLDVKEAKALNISIPRSLKKYINQELIWTDEYKIISVVGLENL